MPPPLSVPIKPDWVISGEQGWENFGKRRSEIQKTTFSDDCRHLFMERTKPSTSDYENEAKLVV